MSKISFSFLAFVLVTLSLALTGCEPLPTNLGADGGQHADGSCGPNPQPDGGTAVTYNLRVVAGQGRKILTAGEHTLANGNKVTCEGPSAFREFGNNVATATPSADGTEVTFTGLSEGRVTGRVCLGRYEGNNLVAADYAHTTSVDGTCKVSTATWGLFASITATASDGFVGIGYSVDTSSTGACVGIIGDPR